MFISINRALAASKARREDNEKGFTLIELLVVVLIIGILSAIAIPIFLGQQAAARESGVRSDITNLKVAMVSKLVQAPNAALPTTLSSYTADFTKGTDSNITIVVGAANVFCISGTSTANGASSKAFAASNTSGTIEGTCVGTTATPAAAAT